MLTIAIRIVGGFIFYAALAAAWVESLFRGAPEPTPPAIETATRIYEWQDQIWCDSCDRVTIHTLVEWTGHDGFCTTDTCGSCGEEIVFDMGTEF